MKRHGAIRSSSCCGFKSSQVNHEARASERASQPIRAASPRPATLRTTASHRGRPRGRRALADSPLAGSLLRLAGGRLPLPCAASRPGGGGSPRLQAQAVRLGAPLSRRPAVPVPASPPAYQQAQAAPGQEDPAPGGPTAGRDLQQPSTQEQRLHQ